MRTLAIGLPCILPLMVLTGCATIQSGQFKVAKEDTEPAFEKVRTRASFELGCPKENLEVTALDIMPQAMGPDLVRQLGVSGCDHRAVYVRLADDSWVLNSAQQPTQPGLTSFYRPADPTRVDLLTMEQQQPTRPGLTSFYGLWWSSRPDPG